MQADLRLSHCFFAALVLLASVIATDAHARSRGWGTANKPQSFSRSNSHMPGWYMGISASVNFVADSSLSEQGGSGLTGELAYEDGYGGTTALGYSFANLRSSLGSVRTELEVGLRNNKLNEVTPTGGVPVALSDDDAMLQTTMLNVFYDIDTRSPWRPYLGLGAGLGRLSIDSVTLNVDETEPLFAYQGMAGLYYQPSSFRNVAVGLGYRYLATVEGDFESTVGSKMNIEYSSHLLEFGTQIRF